MSKQKGSSEVYYTSMCHSIIFEGHLDRREVFNLDDGQYIYCTHDIQAENQDFITTYRATTIIALRAVSSSQTRFGSATHMLVIDVEGWGSNARLTNDPTLSHTSPY